jgi:RHS repeat-associated protein
VHAVEGTTFGKSFSYDNNGNMTWSSDNGSITFYANNLPKFAYKDANNSSHFHYGPNRNRWRHSYQANGTDFNTIYVESLFEKVTDSGSGKVTFKNYIRAGGMMVAMKARDSWGGDNTTYLHGDHLGSVSNYTDGGGSSLVAASYDAFGDRRGSNWTGNPTSGELATMNNLTRRGFTEHEMLDSSALVHMNGRAYNPTSGRFVSADPFFDCGLGTQGWNRYSYVGNRALSASDPTGFWSCRIQFTRDSEWWDIGSSYILDCQPDWWDFFPVGPAPAAPPVIPDSFGSAVPEPAAPAPLPDAPPVLDSDVYWTDGTDLGFGGMPGFYLPTATSPSTPRFPDFPTCVSVPDYPKPNEPNCCQKCTENVNELNTSCKTKCSIFTSAQCLAAISKYSTECVTLCGCDQ